MPITEKATTQEVHRLMATHVIDTDTTTYTAGIDTSVNQSGVAFVIAAISPVTGSFTLTFEHANESNFSDAVPVPPEMLVYKGAIVITDQTVAGAKYAKEGIFSTNRWVRGKIVSAGGADAEIFVFALLNFELLPR